MSAWRRQLGLVLALGVVAAMVAVTFSAVLGVGAGSEVPSSVATPYTVTFNETGLPSGTTWSVHVANFCTCGLSKTVKSDLSSIVIPVANGSYQYSVPSIAGYYVVGMAHGTFKVAGSNVSTVNVHFNTVFDYLVQFTESGLPGGTEWTVTTHGNGTGQLGALEDLVGHSYGTTLDFLLPNGTYHYAVAPVNGSYFADHSSKGTFVVAGSSLAPIPVIWVTPPTYAVTFTEHGLPTGMDWSVQVVGWGGVRIGETLSSYTPNITFYLPNGTYRFVVAEVIFFNPPTPGRGNFSVANASEAYSVSFTPVVPGAFYPVAFQESGLATGTQWSVKIILTHTFGHSRTVTETSSGTTLFVLLQNGTYRFDVYGPRTYTLSSGGVGAFSIQGASPSVFLVSFTPIPTYSVTFTESGLPTGTNWSVLVWSETSHSTPWYIRLTQTSNNSSMTFSLPSGAYCFKFLAVRGYTITAGAVSGPFTVSGGSPAPITAGFTPKK